MYLKGINIYKYTKMDKNGFEIMKVRIHPENKKELDEFYGFYKDIFNKLTKLDFYSLVIRVAMEQYVKLHTEIKKPKKEKEELLKEIINSKKKIIKDILEKWN